MTKTYILPVRKIDREVYDLIKSGEKRIETRGGGPKYNNISDGDIVKIKCEGDSFERKVKNVKKFKSIDEMLSNYSVKDIDPRVSTKEELEKMYKSFPNYKERLAKYGIIAFELEK